VRLRKQLSELEAKVEKVEAAANRRAGGQRDSKPALVRREFEQLLDYKRRQLRALESGKGKAALGVNLKETREDIETVKEQVEGLQAHLESRKKVLKDLKGELEQLKAER
jgi:chromosome segregation ATPase